MLRCKGKPREIELYILYLIREYGEKATLKEVIEKEKVGN